MTESPIKKQLKYGMIFLLPVGATIGFLLLLLLSYQLETHRPQPAPEINPGFPLREIWHYQAEELITTAPVALEYSILVRTQKAIYAVDVSSGSIQWKTEIPRRETIIPARTGNLIIAESDTELLALNARNGQIVWKQAIQTPSGIGVIAASPKRVLVSCIKSGVIAYDMETGQQKWEVIIGRGNIKVFIEGDTTYIVSYNRLQARDLLTGSLLWEMPMSSNGRSVFADGVLYHVVLENEYNSIATFDVHSQVEKWKARLPDEFYAMSLAGDMLLVGTYSGVVAMDALTGGQLWIADVEFGIYQAPLLVGKVVYVRGEENNKIYALSPKDGSILGYVQAGLPHTYSDNDYVGIAQWPDPVTGQRLLIFANGNKVYAFGEKP